MFSVLLPVFNGEKWVHDAIDNLKRQTYADFEVILLFNGCTDESLNIAASQLQDDERFIIVQLSFANKSSALNVGIIMASMDWIAIYDVDDRWHIEKLALQAKELSSNPEVDILGTQMFYIDKEDQVSNAPTLVCENKDLIHQIFEKKSNPICNSSVVYRKSLHFTAVGFYDPQCAVEDYDFWVRCALVPANFKNLPQLLTFHRIHDGSNFNGSKKQKDDKIFIDNMMEYRRNSMQGAHE